MFFKESLTIILSSFSIFFYSTTNYSYSQNNIVTIDFSEPNSYRITCDNQSKLFNNITTFSNEINDITSNYFTVESVNIDTEHLNTIVFNNVNVTNNLCTLVLLGSNNFKPNILFENGIARFYTIRGINIESVVFTNTIFMIHHINN